MKTRILTIAFACSIVLSSFADGTIAFKTSPPKDPLLYSLDGVTATLVPGTGPNTGVVPGYGSVFYEVYTALAGTQLNLLKNGLPDFTGWNATPVGPLTFFGDGLISPAISVTVPGVAGLPVEMEVVAYTGDLSHPSLYGYSGMTFDGSNTVSFNSLNGAITDSTGALDWQNQTGNLNQIPPTPPGAIPTGPTGFGAIVLVSLPDASSTLPLLGATILGLGILRRKLQ